MMPSKLTCRDFVEFLAEYLSEELSAQQAALFNAHLARCPPCVNYLKTYQETLRLAKAAFGCLDKPLSPDVPEGLVQAILSALEETS
jgi:anti-sigma factor RsiW